MTTTTTTTTTTIPQSTYAYVSLIMHQLCAGCYMEKTNPCTAILHYVFMMYLSSSQDDVCSALNFPSLQLYHYPCLLQRRWEKTVKSTSCCNYVNSPLFLGQLLPLSSHVLPFRFLPLSFIINPYPKIKSITYTSTSSCTIVETGPTRYVLRYLHS